MLYAVSLLSRVRAIDGQFAQQVVPPFSPCSSARMLFPFRLKNLRTSATTVRGGCGRTAASAVAILAAEVELQVLVHRALRLVHPGAAAARGDGAHPCRDRASARAAARRPDAVPDDRGGRSGRSGCGSHLPGVHASRCSCLDHGHGGGRTYIIGIAHARRTSYLLCFRDCLIL